jgi:predicted HTH transcriptional regulator
MQPIKRKLEIAMKKPDYYPFDKPADKLDIDDLSVLKLIPENWFIEYKRQAIDRAKLAKEICAFANQNGGYIFFGVGETNSKEKLAGDFIGVSPQEAPQIIQTIELAVSADCHPAVPVEIISIHGKGNNIGMSDENIILMIIVPRSEDTPHIHCSGVIYQRIADSSAPIRDNHELSKLIDRRDEHQKSIERTLTRRLYLNDDIKNTPFLFMCVIT